MGNNVVSASGLSLYSNGKGIEEFISAHAYVQVVVSKRIFAKYAR